MGRSEVEQTVIHAQDNSGQPVDSVPQAAADAVHPQPPVRVVFAHSPCVTRPSLVEGVRRRACVILPATSGKGALDCARAEHATVLVLDAPLSDMRSTDFCAAARRDPSLRGVGILALGVDKEEDRLSLLGAGADACLPEAASPDEGIAHVMRLAQNTLVLRERARRSAASEPLRWRLLRVDLTTHEAWMGDRRLPLRRLERRLLTVLLESPGVTFSRADLFHLVWQSPTFVSRTVDTHVSRLRGALSDYAPALETVRGEGYRWTGGAP